MGRNSLKWLAFAFAATCAVASGGQGTQTRFVGRPITLKLRDTGLPDVFRLIAEASGFNVVVSEQVKGRVTLSIEDVPWDQALDLILKNNHLAAERDGNVIRIASLADLTAPSQAVAAPQVTAVIPIGNAKSEDIAPAVRKISGSPAQ